VDDQCGVVALFVAERVLGGHAPDALLEEFEEFEEFEVVVGVVGCGVARSQHGGQRLVGVVTPHRQGVEPEAVLVGGRGVLLLRCAGETRTVAV
jgi:hypothetical protein